MAKDSYTLEYRVKRKGAEEYNSDNEIKDLEKSRWFSCQALVTDSWSWMHAEILPTV